MTTLDSQKYTINKIGFDNNGFEADINGIQLTLSMDEAENIVLDTIKLRWGGVDSLNALHPEGFGKDGRRELYKPINTAVRRALSEKTGQDIEMGISIEEGSSNFDGTLKDFIDSVIVKVRADEIQQTTVVAINEATA